MRVGRIGGMPFAVDDADGDLALALRERVPAGVKMCAERSCSLRQLGIVHPDLARPAHLAAGLDQRAIAVLLLRRHLVVRNLGIAAKSWCVGHRANSSFWFDCRPILPSRSTHVDGIAGRLSIPRRWPTRIGKWLASPPRAGVRCVRADRIVDTGAANPETRLHGPFGRVSLR